MAALQCEICGGKLIGKPGGIFVCDSCGVEYDTSWDKAKVQEIKGKVQIEGSVQVDTTACKVALIKRGIISLERQNWEEAKEHFNEALNYDAEYAEAYLGLAMAELKASSARQFAELYISDPAIDHNISINNNILYAKRFAGQKMHTWFETIDIKHKQAMTTLKLELKPLRERASYAAKFISVSPNLVGLKSDGTVLNERGMMEWADIVAVSGGPSALRADGTVFTRRNIDVSNWYNITAIADGRDHLVGLRSDGSVVAFNRGPDKLCCAVSSWREIVAIAAGCNHTVGLKKDGTVVAVGKNEYGECDTRNWSDIIAISACGGSYGSCYYRGHTVGLQSDGTVVDTDNDTSKWRNVIAIAAGSCCTFGLMADGTVISTAENIFPNISIWKNVVAIAAGPLQSVYSNYGAEYDNILALKADGTILGDGPMFREKQDWSWSKLTEQWKLFSSIDKLKMECREARKTETKAIPTKDDIEKLINQAISEVCNKGNTAVFTIEKTSLLSQKKTTYKVNGKVIYYVDGTNYIVDANGRYYAIARHCAKKIDRKDIISLISQEISKNGSTRSFGDLQYGLRGIISSATGYQMG